MSKPKSNTATPCHFEVEVLEPRILFSADGLSPVDTDIDPVETVVIETISAEESPTDPNAEDSLFDTADDIQIEVATPAEEPTREPAEPAPAAADFTPSTPLPEPQATAPESISDRPAPVTQNTATDQSAASLNTANGPPQLAGSEAQTNNTPADAPAPQAGSPAALFPHIPALTAPDASPESIAGQVFYLNFTGTTDLNLLDTTLSIPAFEHPDLIPEILASLALTYANSGVTFTADQPATGDYSTIHIGGTDHAFAAHGAFHGLAEKIDPSNTDHNDTALVFAETVLRDNLSPEALANVIAEEAAHLLGYTEATLARPSSPLFALAASTTRINAVVAPHSPDISAGGRDWRPTVSFSVSDPGRHTIVFEPGTTAWTVPAGTTGTLDTGESDTFVALDRTDADDPSGSTETVYTISFFFNQLGSYTLEIDSLLAPDVESYDLLEFEIYGPDGEAGTPDPLPENEADASHTYTAEVATIDLHGAWDPARFLSDFWNSVRDSALFQEIADAVLTAADKAEDFATLATRVPATAAEFASSDVEGLQFLLEGLRPTTELEAGLSVEGEIQVGAAVQGGEVTVRAAEIIGAMKMVWAPQLSSNRPSGATTPIPTSTD